VAVTLTVAATPGEPEALGAVSPAPPDEQAVRINTVDATLATNGRLIGVSSRADVLAGHQVAGSVTASTTCRMASIPERSMHPTLGQPELPANRACRSTWKREHDQSK
jgi:hypothetical protein